MTLLISQVMSLAKPCGLYNICVKLHFTIAIFFRIEQMVHLPSLVQILGVGVTGDLFSGWYVSVALVSMSLRCGSLLNPIIGSLVKSCPQSALSVIMFQFLRMMFLC